jgi:hypothetical protein
MAKRKYANLGDIAKINKQWRKMSGLHGREDWSKSSETLECSLVRRSDWAQVAVGKQQPENPSDWQIIIQLRYFIPRHG